MAYERSWQFLAPVGPRTGVSAGEANAYWMWTVKSFLKGEIGGATQGLWTCYGSSDGTTASLSDGVDRWGTTYDFSKIPLGASGVAKGWIILTRTFDGTQVWMTLCNGGGSVGGYYTQFFSGSAPNTGSTTVTPAASVILGGFTGAEILNTYHTDTTNGRRIYGALSVDGSFWLSHTVAGEISDGLMCVKPVGTKSNDQYPFFVRTFQNSSGNSAWPFSGPYLYQFAGIGGLGNVGKFYNGGAGYQVLIQPPTYTSLDVSDVSLFDIPAWVIVGNTTSPTQLHSRGRLADMGVCCGTSTGSASAQRPCNVGTTIRDGSNNVIYVTLNQMIVPYNTLVS